MKGNLEINKFETKLPPNGFKPLGQRIKVIVSHWLIDLIVSVGFEKIKIKVNVQWYWLFIVVS